MKKEGQRCKTKEQGGAIERQAQEQRYFRRMGLSDHGTRTPTLIESHMIFVRTLIKYIFIICK